MVQIRRRVTEMATYTAGQIVWIGGGEWTVPGKHLVYINTKTWPR